MVEYLKPLTNTLGTACYTIGNAFNSANNALDKFDKFIPNYSIFYGANPWGFGGFGCYPWDCGGYMPYSHNAMILSPCHSAFLGVYCDGGFPNIPNSDPLKAVGGLNGGSGQSGTNDAGNSGVVGLEGLNGVGIGGSNVPSFGGTGQQIIFAGGENPYGTPIYGASPLALRLMGYNVPLPQQYATQQPASSVAQANPFLPIRTGSLADQIFNPTAYTQPAAQQTQNGLPQTFGSNQTRTPQQEKEAKKAEIVDMNAEEFQMEIPTYYSDVANKKARGEKVNANEEQLYRSYQTIVQKSPFEKDSDGQLIKKNGCYIPTKTFSLDIKNLNAAIISHDVGRIKKILDRLSPDDLAAIEYYWTKLPTTGEAEQEIHQVELRAALKDACMWKWCSGWLNWNTGDFEKISDDIDKKLGTRSPRSIACSLMQWTKNCHQWGTGIDRDRVIALLKKMENNPELISAVKEEYQAIASDDLEAAIKGTLLVFSGSETYQTAERILGSAK